MIAMDSTGNRKEHVFPDTPRTLIRRIPELSAGKDDGAWERFVDIYEPALRHFVALAAPAMPTSDEIQALVDNCTTTWITTNGVYGRLVTGKGAYANRSIFLPAAGYGYDSDLRRPGLVGDYWSSTPFSDDSRYSWILFFNSGNFRRNYDYRDGGRSVRPVRGFAD